MSFLNKGKSQINIVFRLLYLFIIIVVIYAIQFNILIVASNLSFGW
jgi:hypothetical protein